MKEIYRKEDLETMMTEVFRLGLEGLVLKDLNSTYEPGKRHWLKVKKDYLFGGAMADSADLVVLGAWYGTGQKGGMMSVFLMGCFDEARKKWCTVTKVHTGHDDATLERLQTELDMVKISKDPSKVPPWLNCTKTMIPDFVAKDPKAQPVWEITGAELTKNVVHTADGISVRFPRVTRIRSDKDWEQATSLAELKELYKKSKETSDFSLSGIIPESTPPSSPKKSPRKRQPVSPLVTKGSKLMKKNDEGSEIENENEDEVSSSSDVSQRFFPSTLPSTSESKFQMQSTKMSKGAEKSDKYILQFALPDVFVGVRIFIPDIVPPDEKAVLERYFVAYGGELLKKHEKEKATHKIGKKVEELNWLWESIREQRLST